MGIHSISLNNARRGEGQPLVTHEMFAKAIISPQEVGNRGLPLGALTRHLMRVVPFKNSWEQELYGPHNTKMHEGRMVRRALYAVTPTPGVVQQFKNGNYDMLLTHHPFIAGHDVPQWIAHTALDNAVGGLNDQWRDALGLKNARHFDGSLGWVGDIDPIPFEDLVKRAEGFTGRPLIGEHHGHGRMINRVVLCTGLGGLVEHGAHRSGADCYVLGEATRHHSQSPFPARIEVGHTLSEHQTGLNFFRKHLNPFGIQVDPSDLNYDKYNTEVFGGPVYNKEFAESPEEMASDLSSPSATYDRLRRGPAR